jgi:PAS domain S-box-containing protein
MAGDDKTREASDAWRMTDALHAEHGKGDPFAAAMRATRMPMLITDPRQEDNPIVFANDAFLRLTGYGRGEVVGRNCRFLQGPDTDRGAVDAIRSAIRDRRDIHVDILNYRKDGTTFWNALFLSPVSNEAGELQFFFASQLDVSDRKASEGQLIKDKARIERAVKERTKELETALEAQTMLLHEVDHRVKNNLQMISSLIVMQARKIPDPDIRRSLTAMLERIEALSTVHRRLYQSDDVTRFDVAEFLRDLVGDLVAASGRDEIGVKLDLGKVEVPAEKAAPIALMINELVTNALRHAFPNGHGGTVSVSVKRLNGHFRVVVEDDGRGMDANAGAGNFGTSLVRSLARQLKADVEWQERERGVAIVISMPVEQRPKGE